MSDNAFKKLCIILSVVVLAIGITSVWPPGLMILGIIGLIGALCIADVEEFEPPKGRAE